MQSVGTWTSICVGVVIGVGSTGEKCVSIPDVVVAGCCSETIVCAWVDGEVECGRAVASRGIDGSECRCIGAGIVCATIPKKAVARGNGFGGSVAVVDVQV